MITENTKFNKNTKYPSDPLDMVSVVLLWHANINNAVQLHYTVLKLLRIAFRAINKLYTFLSDFNLVSAISQYMVIVEYSYMSYVVSSWLIFLTCNCTWSSQLVIQVVRTLILLNFHMHASEQSINWRHSSNIVFSVHQWSIIMRFSLQWPF